MIRTGTKKTLESVLPTEGIRGLDALATALRARSREMPACFIDAAGEVTFNASQAAVYGVRAAKDGLSSLLRDVVGGNVVFVERGGGGTVAMIQVEMLADVIAKTDGKLTLAEAIASLPFKVEGRSLWRAPKGHAPSTGSSGPLRSV